MGDLMKLPVNNPGLEKGLPLHPRLDCYLYSSLLASKDSSVYISKTRIMWRWFVAILVCGAFWWISFLLGGRSEIAWLFRGVGVMVVLFALVLTFVLRHCFDCQHILRVTSDMILLQNGFGFPRKNLFFWIIVESPYSLERHTGELTKGETCQKSLCAVVKEEIGTPIYLWQESSHLDARAIRLLCRFFKSHEMPMITLNLTREGHARIWQELLKALRNEGPIDRILAMAASVVPHAGSELEW